jgi:chromosome segregation ATPase
MISNILHRRLTAISEELSALRDEAGVLTEQLAFAQDVMDEARIRALVAETPLADRDLRIATADLHLVERALQDVEGRAKRLTAEQDRLLGHVGGHEAAVS